MTDTLITTVRDASEAEEFLGLMLAKELDILYIPRVNQSIANLKKSYKVRDVVVITKKGPVIYTAAGEFYFHLSMAELRINNLKNGKHDHMAAAMGLKPGMSVLDCTLGLATDAIVASYIIGATGRIIGLEKTPLIAAVTRLGLQNYNVDDHQIQDAMKRISVERADYNDYLADIPENSFDVVFFDPMFRRPISDSSSLKPLRGIADMQPLNKAAIKRALRVAKERVVIKETRGSTEFERLGINTILGGKYSSISYGVVEAR